MSVQQYALEVVVGKPGEPVTERMVEMTEWAYTVGDAFAQATYNLQKHLKPGERFIRLERIGPPQAEVLAAMEAARTTASKIAGLFTRGKKE